MFRIRRIYDTYIPINESALKQVQEIMRVQFPGIREKDVRSLPDKLRNPLKQHFRSILLVADNLRGQVKGFALVQYDPELKFCLLDYISAARMQTGRGIGGALYERVRQEAITLKAEGLFLESLPDDPKLCPDPQMLKQNIARLRFYEQYGVRPIANVNYAIPLGSGDDNPPYLLFDNLGQDLRFSRIRMQRIIRTILEQKYGDICSPEYIQRIVNSYQGDAIQLRQPRYLKQVLYQRVRMDIPADHKIILVLNDKHEIHHVRERGYVESPIRINSILKDIEPTGMFRKVGVKQFSEFHIKAVHDTAFVEYLKKVCQNIGNSKSVYPYVFPIRNRARPPKELSVRAGYYCIDTFTPLNLNAYLAAKRAVDCTLTAAQALIEGQQLAYALVRPPGHHAEKHSFGGFCYFNSTAVAAQFLSKHGKVAILDVDYHHGNGQQDIFYKRSDVLTCSIHGHPRFAYPYFSGFEDEKGFEEGRGFNINHPLPEQVNCEKYRPILEKALRSIHKFKPRFLIVAFGLDTAKGDPTGTWSLKAKDFEQNGKLIGKLNLPTLIVQEGGYKNRNIGINARHFFAGIWSSLY